MHHTHADTQSTRERDRHESRHPYSLGLINISEGADYHACHDAGQNGYMSLDDHQQQMAYVENNVYYGGARTS